MGNLLAKTLLSEFENNKRWGLPLDFIVQVSSNVDPSDFQCSRHKARVWRCGRVGHHAQEPLLVRDGAHSIEGDHHWLLEVVSVSDHPLRRDVACAVTARAGESEGAVVELVQQSRLSLMVDL